MPTVNSRKREVSFKVVYYGPRMSGKTTNLLQLHAALNHGNDGTLVRLDSAVDRTLFFDYLPLRLGRVDEYSLGFKMYTIPGQTQYEASRRLILDGADGVVFVADSRPEQQEHNLESFVEMEGNLRSQALDLREFPIVLQYNKRDCADPVPVGTVERALGLDGITAVEAVATDGLGVAETMRQISRQVVARLGV